MEKILRKPSLKSINSSTFMAQYHVLSIMSLKKFIQLNENMDIIINNVKCVELNREMD